MLSLLSAPRALLIASGAIVVQSVVLSFSGFATIESVAGLVLSLAIAAFLLRGGRIAWAVAVIGAAAQVLAVVIASESNWVALSGLVILAALLMPDARRFVWTETRPASNVREVRPPHAGVLARISWSAQQRMVAAHEIRVSWRMVGSAVLWTVALFFLDGALAYWLEHGADGNTAVGIIHRLVYALLVLSEIAALGLGVLAAYRHLKLKTSHRRR